MKGDEPFARLETRRGGGDNGYGGAHYASTRRMVRRFGR